METNKKALWLIPGIPALGAIFCLVGGIIGKSIVGWILFAVGFAAVIAVLVLRLKRVKELFASNRLWSLIGSAVLAVMIIVGLVLMLVSAPKSQQGQMAGGMPPQGMQGTPGAGGMPPMSGTPGAGGPQMNAQTTETAAATTAAPTETATETPEPTLTATATPVASIYVCLNENTQVGYNLRVAPQDDAAFGGLLNWGACFYVDGRSTDAPGWYRYSTDQPITINGTIDVDLNNYQLWVKGYYLESFGNDLDTLPVVDATTK